MKSKTRIMKNSITKNLSILLFLPLIILMTFTSCQNEVTEVTDQSEQETIIANSPLANFIQNTAARDGSFDNIIDGANCISINLPVTIFVNGIEITIDTEEDLAVIEAIFDQFSDDNDEVEIVFPITIILNDYETVTINDLEELAVFAAECTGEDEQDDDIECIDFQYPITISIYNSDFVVIDTVEINDDEELYHFIDELEGGILASINFPVNMILADGTIVEVSNNGELEAAIEAAEDACDEDDDNDYDDDDNNDVPVDDLNILCSSCTWTVDKLEIGDQDLEDQYEGYVFTFVPEGPVYVEDPNGTVYEGTWGLTENPNGIPALSLNIPDLPDFNNELWLLHEIDDEDGEIKVDFRSGIDRLRFEQLECDDTNPAVCPEEVIDDYLADCFWRAGFNGDDNFADYEFYFNDNQELVVQHSVNDQEIIGTWMTSTSDTGATIMTIDLGAPLGDLNGEWTVIECDEGRIKIVMNDLYIVFEKECEDDVACTQDQVDAYLLECMWNVVSLNGSNDLIDYDMAFTGDGIVVITGDGQTITAQWVTSVTDQGVWVLFDGVNGSNIQAISGNWLVTECSEDRLKMFNDNNDFMVLEQDCSTDDVCSEAEVDDLLLTCPWTIANFAGDNGFNIFNIAFQENQEATIYTADESEVYTANWSTSQGTNGVEVTISGISGGNVQIIEGTYTVVECAAEQLILHDINNSNNELVLDKDCD